MVRGPHPWTLAVVAKKNERSHGEEKKRKKKKRGMGDLQRVKDHRGWAHRYMRYGDDQKAVAHMKRALHYSEKPKSRFGTGPDCDKSNSVARTLLESKLRARIPEASGESITATVNHWFDCNCNGHAFIDMDTYPKDAIQFKDANGKTRQVLLLLREGSPLASASNKPSLSGTMTGTHKPLSHVPGGVNRKHLVDPDPPSTPKAPRGHETEEDLTHGNDGMDWTRVTKYTEPFDPIFGGRLAPSNVRPNKQAGV